MDGPILFAILIVIGTALTSKYPILGLLLTLMVLLVKKHQFKFESFKFLFVLLASGLFYLKLSTNIGNDLLLRWMLILNVAMMAFRSINIPLLGSWKKPNNVWLALGLIAVSFCTPYFHVKNNSYTLTPSLIPVSMYIVLHTILLSYLYHTARWDAQLYRVQLAVWIPLLMHFTYGNWVESRCLALLLYMVTRVPV